MEEIDFGEIGKRIREARLQKGLTQEQLAERVGVGTTHISHIETDNSVPSISTFVSIVNALNISADELLCGALQRAEHIYIGRLNNLLSDCTTKELRVFTDVIATLKASMRKE